MKIETHTNHMVMLLIGLTFTERSLFKKKKFQV